MNKPSWWPQNPYPEDIFPMTVKDYVRMVPDPERRTALTGCLGRLFWSMASDAIYEAFKKNIVEADQEDLRHIHYAVVNRNGNLWSVCGLMLDALFEDDLHYTDSPKDVTCPLCRQAIVKVLEAYAE